MKRSLFGHGHTTKALARSGGWDIYDDRFTCKEADALGNMPLPPSAFNPATSTLEIPSPGFPPSHSLVHQARHLQSEYDYFADCMPYSVWITGTNGKTTTTQMLYHLLKDRGALAGGNIGTPLAELSPDAPLWILETSSFTLHYTNKARPDVFVLLPIKPDHLSWHGGFDAYETAKLKPLATMSEGSVAILPTAYANTPTNAHIISYTSSDDLAKFSNVDIDALGTKEPFLLDALLALCVERVLFGTCSLELLQAFTLDPHKLQELHDAKGRLWVNDTKGTNLDATLEALKRYETRQIALILGGDDKGVDLTRLFEAMAPMRVVVYAIGSNMKKLLTLAKSYGVKAYACERLEVAVEKIDKTLDHRGVGLLSPAAASLDQFSSYIERGNCFIACVNGLK
jgi:UDP-N-acetylmuramoylalanine--D-glutamate ligase